MVWMEGKGVRNLRLVVENFHGGMPPTARADQIVSTRVIHPVVVLAKEQVELRPRFPGSGSNTARCFALIFVHGGVRFAARGIVDHAPEVFSMPFVLLDGGEFIFRHMNYLSHAMIASRESSRHCCTIRTRSQPARQVIEKSGPIATCR